MTPTALGPDLWIVDHALSMGGLRLGTRTTLARLKDGSLLLHAPGPFDEAGYAAIRALGPVSAVVAPNLMHHLYLGAAAAAFPGAVAWGAPGLKEKVKGVRVDRVLEPGLRPWGDEVRLIPVGGAPKVGELLFHLPGPRALLFTDLAFNVQGSDHWLTRTVMKWNNGLGRFGLTRLGMSMVKDRAAVKRAIDEALEAPLDIATVTHGEVVRQGASAIVREAYADL